MIVNKPFKRRRVGCYWLSLHTTDQTKSDGVYEIQVTQTGGHFASGSTACIALALHEIDYPMVTGCFESVRSFFDYMSSEDQVFKLLHRFGYDEACEQR